IRRACRPVLPRQTGRRIFLGEAGILRPPCSIPAKGLMVPTICLFTCVLATGQPADRAQWLLVPRLSRGQELTYRGTFSEEAIGQGVMFQRLFQLESNILVLDTLPKNQGYEVAFLTSLELRPQRLDRPIGGPALPPPTSFRLELARVDMQGRVLPSSG